ncbi:hypothetical protein GCM10007377_12380 [Galliscardovia ingluviei]|uniref:Uncharacterized protein n=1 Tax=Galliscardovia ingluviei TaxID=1769422 RepID=A0A8J3AL10_9BIFI|nr:hypothetical protein [Galliscardovia ingluviei]GGI14730.1 hypothetical protein GCM10007377_12380 [Galliscardovia ingluviei]
MQDESKQLVELMLGDAEARLKRMKTSAAQVAKALVALREAEQAASDAIAEYMSASGTSKSQLIHDLALSNVEARLVGLIAPARARKRSDSAIPEPAEPVSGQDADTAQSQNSGAGDDVVQKVQDTAQQWGEYHG